MNARYDTVVVGGGSAGSVLAARLSEDPAHRVLLLEAGPDVPPGAPRPEDLRNGRRNSLRAHDWGLWHDATQGQIRMPFPRGRVMGGSSAVNTCIALRAIPEDFEAWVARGLSDWSWDRVLPFFRRLETDEDFDTPAHGREGPLKIRRPVRAELTPWQAAFHEACDQLGFAACPDSNDPSGEGHGPHALNRSREGARRDVASAWLTASVRARPNLGLVDRALVSRVRFTGRRVSGIAWLRDGAEHAADATRVVLAGGAIHTPGVLLRSGVGPRDVLARLGVQTVSDVPAVSARVLDHPGGAVFFAPRRFGVADLGAPIIQNVLRLRSEVTGLRNDLLVQPGAFVHFPWFSAPVVSIMCAVGRSRGHGTLRWPSADPRSAPVLDSRLLDHPDDRARLREGLTWALRLGDTAPMRALARAFWPLPRVARDPVRFDAFLPRICGSGYHPCGTVPMGAPDDPAAATDARGTVRGVDGLHVVDASLFPEIPSANIHLTVLMVAERLAAHLRGQEEIRG